ncbi:MAG: sterol desaturase family protein [Lysobacter sp.]|nr:sterol desaturase family protein [Lysobacter sp.]
MIDAWTRLVAWLGDNTVLPFLRLLHLDGLSGDPREIAAALLVAALQIAIIGLLFRPLETWKPAERWTDRRLTRVDRQYTMWMLLGIFPLFTYLVLTPISHLFGGGGDADGGAAPTFGLAAWLPALRAHPFLLFAVYYLAYDLVYYAMHRLQHALPWWWALHSMHHSQRQMSCWTNDRGTLIDGFLQSMVLSTVGVVMGVGPDQFAWLMLLGELGQNFSHTNTRVGFGPLFERIFVDPTFHRLHHMRADDRHPGLHNCNYGQVLSIWDQLFGTALYGMAPRPTGVGDPTVDADNHHGLIGLHWVAMYRFWRVVRRRSGWRLGEVSFGPDYAPVPVVHGAAHGHAEAWEQAAATSEL